MKQLMKRVWDETQEVYKDRNNLAVSKKDGFCKYYLVDDEGRVKTCAVGRLCAEPEKMPKDERIEHCYLKFLNYAKLEYRNLPFAFLCYLQKWHDAQAISSKDLEGEDYADKIQNYIDNYED